MVLEKTGKVPIWGKADPGEEVTVTLGGQSVKAKAGTDGRWMTALNLKDSPTGPFEMTVEGKNKLALSDVLVGEVWIASGQSNMVWVLRETTGGAAEVAQSANPLLRQFHVKLVASPESLDDTEGQWVAASPETSGDFCATGYYFAKKLQNELKVPVGLVQTSWGGTPVEAWTSVEAIDSVPDLKAARARLWTADKEYPAKKKAFVEGMDSWVKESAREDKPVADPSAYAGLDVSQDGWIPVAIPGAVTAPGLPEAGAVWLRKDVTVSKNGDILQLTLPVDGYDSVYWNGTLIKQTTYRNFPGTGYVRKYNISPDRINEGRNVLAIRLYEPVAAAKFTGAPLANVSSLAGTWLAKAEFAFPAVDAQKSASAPRAPAMPPNPNQVASYLYNGMISPILPYAMRGVIWYQGETNADRAWQYRTAFPLLITDWHKQWNQGDFPFYFCQLANFMGKKSEPSESSWAELREAQSQALKLPNTGQAVLIDIGEAADIHPKNKKDAGERLARIALAKDYGRKIPFSGPVYQSMKVEGGKIRLAFTHSDGGLVAKPLPATYDVKTIAGKTAPLVRNSPNSELEGFAICGADHKWVWGDAKIDGDSVVVWSDKVPAPVAVRYAWADNPTCNLYNKAGLPAAPFRTDNDPAVTKDAVY
ncbi:MAG: acetyl esterase [Verrucomicrobiaceae bacterium]|nr:MAG: acetyl esterase [Verrucomicrobiaceae bacterium]